MRLPASWRRHPWISGAVGALLVFVLGCLAAAWWQHARGLARLREVQARLRAHGGADPDDLMATLAPVDPTLADAAWARLGSNSVWRGWPMVSPPDPRDNLDDRALQPLRAGAGWVPDERDRALLAQLAPGATDLRLLLADPRLIIGSGMWVAQDLKHWRTDPTFAFRMPNLQTTRAGVTYFGFAVCCGDLTALADLDHIHAALRPLTLVEALIALDLDRRRDDAYVELAVLGLVEPLALATWAAEPPRAHRLLTDGTRGERQLWLGRYAELELAGIHAFTETGWHNPLGLADWLHGADAMAESLERLEQLELGSQIEPPQRERYRWLVSTSELAYMNWEGMLEQADQHQLRHRLARIAGALAARGRIDGLPADQVEAEAILGAAAFTVGESGSALRYARVDPRSFRIEVVPSANETALIRNRTATWQRRHQSTREFRIDISCYGALVDLDPSPLPEPKKP